MQAEIYSVRRNYVNLQILPSQRVKDTIRAQTDTIRVETDKIHAETEPLKCPHNEEKVSSRAGEEG